MQLLAGRSRPSGPPAPPTRRLVASLALLCSRAQPARQAYDETRMRMTEAERRERNENLQRTMLLLVHACSCTNPECTSTSCRKVQALFRHAVQCELKIQGNCATCKKMWCLLTLHAKSCTKNDCQVRERRRGACRRGGGGEGAATKSARAVHVRCGPGGSLQRQPARRRSEAHLRLTAHARGGHNKRGSAQLPARSAGAPPAWRRLAQAADCSQSVRQSVSRGTSLWHPAAPDALSLARVACAWAPPQVPRCREFKEMRRRQASRLEDQRRKAYQQMLRQQHQQAALLPPPSLAPVPPPPPLSSGM